MKTSTPTQLPSPTTVLVGLSLPGGSRAQTEENLNELASLALTRGVRPVASFLQQLDRPHARTWIGSGKVEEVATFVKANRVDSVLFDDELSPGKVKNLTKLLGCKVWDRTLLILEIFAMRAQTVQAKTQVELAQYQYLLPRLTKMWTHLSRQKGRAGMQGTGEKELETDRRMVQKKIHLLKHKLSLIAKQGATQRKRRKSCVNVALVGYTNAGKSTLMKALSRVDTLIEDKLFATLSTTVRKVVLRDVPFLLSDTVGFIHKLPPMLVACFTSTLAEVLHADLLLHVVDFSSPYFTHHIQVVKDTLKSLKAESIPMVLVFNKIDVVSEDRLEEGGYVEVAKGYAEVYECPVVVISAEKKINLSELKDVLYKEVSQRHARLYPQSKTSCCKGEVVDGSVVQRIE